MDTYIVLEFVLTIVWSLIWGFATASVRDSKGYGRKWFWFGFFCGFVPFIIACAIPDNRDRFDACAPGGLEQSLGLNAPEEPKQSIFSDEEFVQQTVAGGGWQCSCGRAHPAYVSTCACGLSKRQNAPSEEYAARVAQREGKQQAMAAEVKKYKMMLDSGFITQEEYVKRVKELYEQ